MVIQRWQTVFLFLAAVLTVIFCFIPVATVIKTSGIESTIVFDSPYFLIFNLATAALLFIAIFLFTNTRRQRLITLIAILLIAIQICFIARMFYKASYYYDWTISLRFGCLLLPAALIATFMAYRRILADEKLLRSYDRLR